MTSESVVDVYVYPTSVLPIVLGKELYEEEVQLNMTNSNKSLSVNPLLKEKGRTSKKGIDQNDLKFKNKEYHSLKHISTTTSTTFLGKRRNEGYTKEGTVDYPKQTQNQITNFKTIESLTATAEFLAKEERFASFNAALKVAFPKGINIKAPFTVFAATNDAFSKISKQSLAWLLGNHAALTRVMKRHLLAGANKIPLGRSVMETAGISRISLRRTVDEDGLEEVDVRTRSGASQLEEIDILTTDGVVHAINTIIL